MGNERKRLPCNWLETTLGEVCTDPQYGYTTKGASTGSLHLLRTTDITSGRIEWNTVPYCSDNPPDESKYLLQDGDIVISRAGSIGVSHLVRQPERSVFASYLIRFKPLINVEFFKHYLDSQSYWSAISEKRLGIAVPNVNANKLKTIRFPLPPLREQQRIVMKIEELFSELDNAIANLHAAQKQLTVYRQTTLDQAASGRLLVSRGVITEAFGHQSLKALRDIVLELGQGWSPRCLNHPTPDEGLWGVIKTTAIQHGAFDASEHKQLPDRLEPRPHLSIVPGDILITRAGPRKRVGVACLVKNCRHRLMLCDKAYRLRVNEQKVIPAYLEMLLNSPRVLQDMEELKTGINDSGVNLTQDRFLALKLLLPSLELQRRTLEELEAVMSQIDHLTGQIESSLAQAVRLGRAILDKAFSGQLVAQDTEDEPASTLLERIKAEKDTNNKKIKGKAAA